MPANAVVRARIDEKVKEEAAAVLAAMGLTLSDAFRLLLVKIAAEQRLPFDMHVPLGSQLPAKHALIPEPAEEPRSMEVAFFD